MFELMKYFQKEKEKKYINDQRQETQRCNLKGPTSGLYDFQVEIHKNMEGIKFFLKR